MKNVILAVSLSLTTLIAPIAAAQGSGDGSGQGSASGRGDGQAATAATTATQDNKALAEKLREVEAARAKLESQNNPRFVRTLTNVQIELTLSDQAGSNPPDKKTVTMVVSSGSWGKIRSAANVFQIGEPQYVVELNVDARPFVSVEGPIQLEMTLVYAPLKGAADPREGPRQRPSGVNQSQTVVLQSGKPLVVSQGADPVSDRKIVVEVKATVLK